MLSKLAKVFDTIFGCWHLHYSFPITVRHAAHRGCAAAAVTGTYVVCLDCGREFPYDWQTMKIVGERAEGHRMAAFATKEA